MTPLTPSEARIRLNAACDLLRDAREELSRRNESLKACRIRYEAGLDSAQNLVHFQQSADIMQEVIIRLMVRIERLELEAGIYDEKVPWSEFEVITKN